MANVLSLALRVTADASRLRLDPVQRALVGLGDQADKLTGQFAKFAAGSEGAARAQEDFARRSQELINTLRDGGNATQFAAAFERLSQEATELAAAFEEGARVTAAVRTEEEKRATELERLDRLLQQSAISQETYDRAVAEASGANREAARAAAEAAAAAAEAEKRRLSVLEEGARVTASVQTEQERRAAELERLGNLLRENAISEETYNRAVAEASGANREAAREAAEAAQRQAESERARASATARAAQVIQSTLTPTERYARELAELQTLQQQGLLSQEQFNRAVAAARKPLDDAAAAAERNAQAGQRTTLQFNELSGVFAVLPGPLGNIAGRISGLASASEGLSRVMAGGLTQAIATVNRSLLALLANPVVLAAAAIAAIAAAARSAVTGLASLESRVETLSRLSTQLGVSFEFVQVLEEAGRRADVSIEQLSGSFARLQNTLAGADEESKKATAALQRLGVSVQDFSRLSEQQRIDLIGERLAAIEDPAQRSAAAIALFGRSGVQLLPFFRELSGAAEDIETFGSAISDTQRSEFERLGASFDQVGVALAGLGQSVLTPFIGIVEGLARTFAGLVNVVTSVAQAIGSVLGPVLNEFGGLFGGIADGINATVGFLRGFFVSTQAATENTERLAEATKQVKFDDRPAKAYAAAVGEINKNLREAFREANQFGQAGLAAARKYSDTIAVLKREFAGRIISENSFKDQVDRATEAYRKQIAVIREAREEINRNAQAELDAVNRLIEANNRSRLVNRVFGGDENRARAFDNLAAITNQLRLAEQQLGRAREINDEQAIRAAEDRLRALREVASQERDIASGQRKFEEEAAARRIQQNQEIANRRLEAERAVEQRIADERSRVNQFVNEQLALERFGGDSQRLQAARQVAEIEREIARVQATVDQARRFNNTALANAGVARIAQLDQIAAKERDIASGRAAREAEIAKQREEAAAREQQLIEQAIQQRDEAIQRQQAAVQQQQEAERRAFEEQARAAAEEADRQERRIRALNSIGQQSIGIGDIRTSEGAGQFLQAAAGALDPTAVALAEARAQTKLLRQIVANSGSLRFLEQGIGSTFTFLGGGA